MGELCVGKSGASIGSRSLVHPARHEQPAPTVPSPALARQHQRQPRGGSNPARRDPHHGHFHAPATFPRMCCLVTWLNDGSDGPGRTGLRGRMPLVGLETISDRSGMVLAETGQHVQLIRQPRTENSSGRPRWYQMTPKRRSCSPRPGTRGQGLAQRPMRAIRTADSFRAFFPVSLHDHLRHLVRHGRVGRAGRDRAWAVQEERERMPLGRGERGCRLGHLPDPGIQAAAGVLRGSPLGS